MAPKLRRHWTIECLFECGDEILLTLRGGIESAVAFGETFCFADALLACPRVMLDPIADHMDGQLKGGIVKLPA